MRVREIGVEWNGDRACADRAPERRRVVDRVVQKKRDALLVLHAEFAQGIGKADAACLQAAIGERALRVDECDLVAKAARDIGVDEIGDGVVRAAQFVQHAAPRSHQLSNNRVRRRCANTPATRRR